MNEDKDHNNEDNETEENNENSEKSNPPDHLKNISDELKKNLSNSFLDQIKKQRKMSEAISNLGTLGISKKIKDSIPSFSELTKNDRFSVNFKGLTEIVEPNKEREKLRAKENANMISDAFLKAMTKIEEVRDEKDQKKAAIDTKRFWITTTLVAIGIIISLFR